MGAYEQTVKLPKVHRQQDGNGPRHHHPELHKGATTASFGRDVRKEKHISPHPDQNSYESSVPPSNVHEGELVQEEPSCSSDLSLLSHAKNRRGFSNFGQSCLSPQLPRIRSTSTLGHASMDSKLGKPAGVGRPLHPSRAHSSLASFHYSEGGHSRKSSIIDSNDDEDDAVVTRLISLPDMICKAANGEIFIVDLSDVQKKVHLRRLGQEGVNLLRRFEVATNMTWDLEKWKDNGQLPSKLSASQINVDDEMASPHGERDANRAAQKLTMEAAAAASLLNPTRLEDLDEGVRQHLLETMELVEAHRDYIYRNSERSLTLAERQEAERRHHEHQQAAVTFAVNNFIPQKLVAMANTRRTSKTSGLFEKLKASITPDVKPGEAPYTAPEAAPASKWRMAHLGMDAAKDAVNKMPYMEEWLREIRHLKKQEDNDFPTGWDALLSTSSTDMYVKGSGNHQGAAVYSLKCHQLGVVPSSQVIQQLTVANANMSHCKLGRYGAAALRHALLANTCMTTLNLEDNGFDAKAVEEIVSGLTSSSMARDKKKRNFTIDRWKKLDWLKAPKTDIEVSFMPPSVDKLLQANSLQGSAAKVTPAAAAAAASKESSQEGGLQPTSSVITARSSETIGLDGSESIASDSMVRFSPNGIALGPKKGIHLPGPTAKVAGMPASILSAVQSLDISDNPIGINGAKLIADLLDPDHTPCQFLTEIKLNKCGIPEYGGMVIIKAIMNGNNLLRLLHMSNNMLGNKTAFLLGELLQHNEKLVFLDFSWNMIKPEGVEELCKGLESNTTLTTLNLSWNGLEDEGGMKLGQVLTKNQGLKHIDLTNTRINSEAALMIAEALKKNRVLEVLILNGNLVGDDGARHLMSALKVNTTLQYLGLQGTNMSSAARGHSSAADFNPLAPDGTYQLDLMCTTDRTVALQLCSLDASSEQDLMKNIKLSGRNIMSCKEQNWPDQLPVSGLLQCDFVSKRVQKVVEPLDPKKLQSLQAQLESSSMSDKERLTLVDVMAPFTYFHCNQISTVLMCFSMGSELVEASALLFTRATDLEENITMITECMTEHDVHELHDLLGWYSYSRFSNPTGHYEFNLSRSVHQHFAVRLKDVAHAESPDCTNWINIVHDMYSRTLKVPGNFGPPEGWKGVVPNKGTLSFDFVSAALPPEGAVPISSEELLDFLIHGIGIQHNATTGFPIPEKDMDKADLQLALLRQEVGPRRFHVTCAQVVRVMQCFLAGPHRVEVVVLFYALVVDRDNFWTLLYSMSATEQGLAMWRLGPQNLFNKDHPSVHYILDLANPSHEFVARKLVEIAGSNSEYPNMWNIRLGGKKRTMAERNMWGTITAETFTPFLEVDFLGPDVFQIINKSPVEVEAMGKGDKVDIMSKLGKRYELRRIKDMYAYYDDGSGWQRPPWQSHAILMKPLLAKAPWTAAWDRLMRLLVRYEERGGNIVADSFIEDIFDEHSNDDSEMTAEAFEVCCSEWGYTKAEVKLHYRRLFEAHAQPSQTEASLAAHTAAVRAYELALAYASRGASDTGTAAARASGNQAAGAATLPDIPPPPATPPLVIDFSTFVNVFMQEPPADLRFKEAPAAPVVKAVVAPVSNKAAEKAATKSTKTTKQQRSKGTK